MHFHNPVEHLEPRRGPLRAGDIILQLFRVDDMQRQRRSTWNSTNNIFTEPVVSFATARCEFRCGTQTHTTLLPLLYYYCV